MPKESLYKICLKTVGILLIKETWKHCSKNPFSKFPSKIIDDLLELLKYESIHQIRPLTTSDTLANLKLFRHHFQAESYLFQKETLEKCFKCLRFLDCHTEVDSHISLIQKLLRSCPKLEEFHSSIIFPLDALETCKELRILRFNLRYRETKYKLSNKDLSVLASLRNLKVVSYIAIMDTESIANVLKHCPQLTSMGRIDSLNVLEKIHANKTGKGETDAIDIPDQFQLKSCVWGRNIYELNCMENDVILYRSSFPEKIRIAVSLCPFVEELVFRVSHSDSIENLKNLNRLTRLQISFINCDGDCIKNFISVLKVIGQKLKYLNVDTVHFVPVDIICECCPYLETLIIVNMTTSINSVQPHHNVLLKRLSIMTSDQNALLFLLASCKGLVELHIGKALCLEDSLLDRILRLNPLEQLKLCIIIRSSLSQGGFRKILEKGVSLEAVKFDAFQPKIKSDVVNLIYELNLTNVTYNEMLTFKDELDYNF